MRTRRLIIAIYLMIFLGMCLTLPPFWTAALAIALTAPAEMLIDWIEK